VVTAEAKKIAEQLNTNRTFEREFEWQNITERSPLPESFNPAKGKKEVKIEARGLNSIHFGTSNIDLQQIEQIVDISQTRAIGFALYFLSRQWMDGQLTVRQLLERLQDFWKTEGLDNLNPFRKSEEHPGNFAQPRTFEVAAALNRYRRLRVRQIKTD